jgi:tetratricopeptide (TPR) repeat protein
MKSKFQNFSAKTGVLSILKKGIFLFFVMSLLSLLFQPKGKQRSEGRKQKYNSKKYIEAEIDYRKGLEKNPKSFEENYNLGNSLFRQKKYEEAYQQYEKAASYAPKTEK